MPRTTLPISTILYFRSDTFDPQFMFFVLLSRTIAWIKKNRQKSDSHEFQYVSMACSLIFFYDRFFIIIFHRFQFGFFFMKENDHKYWLISFFIEEISHTHANSGRKHAARSNAQLHILSYSCENWIFLFGSTCGFCVWCCCAGIGLAWQV